MFDHFIKKFARLFQHFYPKRTAGAAIGRTTATGWTTRWTTTGLRSRTGGRRILQKIRINHLSSWKMQKLTQVARSPGHLRRSLFLLRHRNGVRPRPVQSEPRKIVWLAEIEVMCKLKFCFFFFSWNLPLWTFFFLLAISSRLNGVTSIGRLWPGLSTTKIFIVGRWFESCKVLIEGVNVNNVWWWWV